MPGRRLTPEKIQQVRAMRADGHTAVHVARVVGCSAERVRQIVPGYIGKVPVAPLREAFLESGLPAAEVARRVGWWYCSNRRKASYADGARVKRTLGILPTLSRGYRNRRQLVDAETVMLLAEAIGVGWWEVMPDEDSGRDSAPAANATGAPVMVAA